VYYFVEVQIDGFSDFVSSVIVLLLLHGHQCSDDLQAFIDEFDLMISNQYAMQL
jgi:hypothetical protein